MIVNWNHPNNDGLSSWHIVGANTQSGPLWLDLCGNYDGTLTNASIQTCWDGATRSGQWGALKHAGGTDSVALANGGGLAGVQAGTISMWACWTSTTQEISTPIYGALCGRTDVSTWSNQIIGLNGTNPNTASIIWNPYASNVTACTSTAAPGVNVWKHILITYKSGDHRLYIDGVFDVVATTAGTINSTVGQNFTLGSFYTSNLIGMIDGVRIWPNRILNATEIWDEYTLTTNYSRGLLLPNRRFASPGSAFKPAWASRCNRYMSAGIL